MELNEKDTQSFVEFLEDICDICKKSLNYQFEEYLMCLKKDDYIDKYENIFIEASYSILKLYFNLLGYSFNKDDIEDSIYSAHEKKYIITPIFTENSFMKFESILKFPTVIVCKKICESLKFLPNIGDNCIILDESDLKYMLEFICSTNEEKQKQLIKQVFEAEIDEKCKLAMQI